MSLALVVEIIGDASKLSGELGKAGSDLEGFGGITLGTVAKVTAIAGVAGIAASAIIGMTEAAAADRDEQDKLNQAIAAATGSTKDYTTEIDAAIEAGQAKAFTDSETRDAMQSLVTATHDVTAATALLGPAQDVARLAGVDLATAADAVAKAQAGQDGPLRKLIPGLEKGATATDTLAAATKLAAGQADTYAKSQAGMSAIAGDSLSELSETIGSVFLPILDAIVPALIPILKSFGELVKSLLPLLIPLIKILAQQLVIAAGILSTIVGWLVKLVTWLGSAIDSIGKFLDSINPLKGISLPSLPFLSASTSAAGTAGVGRSAGRAGTSGAPLVAGGITVYTTGDGIEAEQAVVRALRRVTRINGGVIPAAGWTTG